MTTTFHQSTGFPFIHKWLQNSTNEHDNCLEIACGPCQYLPSIKDNYIGFDLSAWAYERNPKNVRKPDVIASGRWLPFTENSFDLIFCVASFYFIPGPLFSLKDCLRILKPGKRIIIFDYTQNTLLRLSKMFYDENIEHVNIWTAKQLKDLFKYSGFVNIKQVLNRPKTWWKKIIAPIYKHTLIHTPIHDMKDGWNIITALKPF